MKTLRCLISNIPQKLLSDIVLRSVQQQTSIEVIGDVSTDNDLPALVKENSVDLLLVGIERSALPQAFNEMLDGDPDLLIVGLVDDGRSAAIFVNDIGAAELNDVINTFGAARTDRCEK